MTPAMSPPGEAAIEGFIERVKATARKYSLWQRGQRVLVAVSGGPDSVTLLDALVRLAPEEGLGLVVGHFNHGLRGAEAEADALYVERLAGDYGLPFVLGHGDVRAEAPHLGRGIEAAARELRHRFLRWAAADRGCDLIALGHTASDRVETVLMHLLRGSGLWGLRGIPPRRLPFVRPLVELWRSDTEAYCAAMGLEWRLDRTNLEAGASLRNKIRHKLLPLLEREYRHGAQEAVLRCAEAVDLELEWTEPMVKYVLGDAAEIAEGRARLRLKSLKSLPPGLLMRVLRSAAQEALGPLRDWSRVHFEALREAVDKGRTGHVVVLPAGHEARVSYGWLEIGAGTVEVPEIPERLLPVPGSVELPEAAIRLTARIVPRSEAPEPGPNTAILSRALAEGLTVRSWRPGDRFFPLGAPGTKKLHDFFVDSKVPRTQRGRVALVVHSGTGIIWVTGMRISQEGIAHQGDDEVLVIELVRSGAVLGGPRA